MLDGEPGDWLPEGFEVIAQRGDGLDERLAHAFADVGEPAVLIGMDTPQVTPELLALACARLAGAGRRRGPRAPRRTAATGRSACARPAPSCCTACR